MGEGRYTEKEIARDNSEVRRLLGNAKVTLWDIDNDELTDREKARLSTIIQKIDELEDIIEEREIEEIES